MVPTDVRYVVTSTPPGINTSGAFAATVLCRLPVRLVIRKTMTMEMMTMMMTTTMEEAVEEVAGMGIITPRSLLGIHTTQQHPNRSFRKEMGAITMALSLDILDMVSLAVKAIATSVRIMVTIPTQNLLLWTRTAPPHVLPSASA